MRKVTVEALVEAACDLHHAEQALELAKRNYEGDKARFNQLVKKASAAVVKEATLILHDGMTLPAAQKGEWNEEGTSKKTDEKTDGSPDAGNTR